MGPNVSNDLPRSKWGGLAAKLGHPVGDVLPDGEADHVAPCVGGGDVLAAVADDDDELALVVAEVAAHLDCGSGADEAGGELGEHQRRLRHFHATLVGVGLVVEADGERLLRVGDWGVERHVDEVAGGGVARQRCRQGGQLVGMGDGLHRVGAQ